MVDVLKTVFPTCVGMNRVQYLSVLLLRVFPTCVGMNRCLQVTGIGQDCVPHMRGDEPQDKYLSGFDSKVFPTCVGMNRE